MVRHTKPLSGGGKDKFLRGIVDGVDGIPQPMRRALSKHLAEAITEVRVRREAYERVRGQPETSTPVDETSTAATVTPAPATPRGEPSAFDPFAFSVVAVLTKKGKPTLVAELEKIDTLDHLRRIADAQHLALDPDLRSIADIRAAIVSGAERRIAERKAAAS
jgi:hypothetical protein